MSKQHDELETRAALEKRLGLAERTRKAADKYGIKMSGRYWFIGKSDAVDGFLAGVRWERRRRAREGY